MTLVGPKGFVEAYPPFIWPEPRVWAGHAKYRDPIALQEIVQSASGISGIVAAPDHRGVAWLETVVTTNLPKIALVLGVYAGCSTRSRDLQVLRDLQRERPAEVEFRIKPASIEGGLPSNCLCIMQSDNALPTFAIGASPNFGFHPQDPTEVNFAFRADAGLANEWRKWFEWIWHQSAPLNDDTVQIPALVPASGTLEAAKQWQAFVANCNPTREAEKSPTVAIEPNTGEVSASTPGGNKVDAPPTSAALPKLDRVAERVARIYEAGQQVVVAAQSSIGPLDAPIRPDLLGVDRMTQVGVVSRTQSFRISVFDDHDRRALDAHLKGTQKILSKLAFSIGTGIDWLPNAAQPLVDAELDAMNAQALKHVAALLKGDARTFVEGKRAKIHEDIKSLYNDVLGLTGEPPAHVLTAVMEELTQRCGKLVNERLLSRVTYSGLRASIGEKTSWGDPWSQAASLLFSIASFPRKVLKKRSMLQGLITPSDVILRAMNVADDAILRPDVGPSTDRRIASELTTLDWIHQSESESNVKCEAILAVIEGRPVAEVQRMILGEEQGK